jgi:hypothetical protein
MPWNTNIANRIRTAAGIPAQTPPPPTPHPGFSGGYESWRAAGSPVSTGGTNYSLLATMDERGQPRPAGTNIPGLPPAQPGPVPFGGQPLRDYQAAHAPAPTPHTAGPVPFGGPLLQDYTAGPTPGPPPAPSPSAAPAGPSPLQAGIQEMIGPQESDPYEAWKAGGRSGARPAGY